MYDSSPMMDADLPDIATAGRETLSAALVALQRTHRTATHEIVEQGVVPDGIDQQMLAWWIEAAAQYRRLATELATVTSAPPVAYRTPRDRAKDAPPIPNR